MGSRYKGPLAFFIGLFIFLLMASFFINPFIPWHPVIASQASIQDIDQYLLRSESSVINLKAGTEKKVIWFHQKTKQKTPLSIIYFHGFSASRQDLAPAIEMLANELKANLFLTRLKAHGQDAEAFADVTAQDWINDAQEAMTIGQTIGEKVIAIGESTGALLAVHLAFHQPQLLAQILISPNFKVKNPWAIFASSPFGLFWSHIFVGFYRSFTPQNTDQEKYWTTRYRIEGITALMNLVKYIHQMDFKLIQQPTLILYSEKDHTINTTTIKERYQELISPHKKIIAFNEATNPHVIAGRILSPNTTDNVVAAMAEFIKNEVLK